MARHPADNVAAALLEAGRVTRFHATPHIQPYNVATHSWGMAALLFELYVGTPRNELIWSILFHDVAERWVGDMPSPGKWWISPEASGALKEAEKHILSTMGVRFALTELEQCWLHALDLLELHQFCNAEINMGNTNMEQAMAACWEVLQEPWVPTPIKEWLNKGEWDGRSDDGFGRKPS